MVKFPPGGRARGPEAEPAGQPLVAQLKQTKADMARGQEDEFDLAFPLLIEEIEKLVIRANKADLNVTSASFALTVPVTHSHLGVTVTGKGIRSRVEQWATENGLSIRFDCRVTWSPVVSQNIKTKWKDKGKIGNLAQLHGYLLHVGVQPGERTKPEIWHLASVVLDMGKGGYKFSLKSSCCHKYHCQCSTSTCRNAGGGRINWKRRDYLCDREGGLIDAGDISVECHRVTISWAEEEE